jgi:hypothetical protein
MARWIAVPAVLLAGLSAAAWIAVNSLSNITLDPFDVDLGFDEDGDF